MFAENSFSKVNDEWCVRTLSLTAKAGDTVTVTLASGATKQVTLGEQISSYPTLFKVAPRAAAAPKVEIGSLAGILAIFDRAAQHLKFPAIVLLVDGIDGGVRVSRAGANAKFPGSLNVTSFTKDDSEYGRTWYGRVTLDGKYSPSRDSIPAIATALAAFAANPAKVAAEFGRLTGNCCFCRRTLTDERSTAVGYGAICADHYGLPWGTVTPLTCEEA